MVRRQGPVDDVFEWMDIINLGLPLQASALTGMSNRNYFSRLPECNPLRMTFPAETHRCKLTRLQNLVPYN